MVPKIRAYQLFTYLALIVFAGLFFYLNFKNTGVVSSDPVVVAKYYLHLTLDPLKTATGWILVFYTTVLLIRTLVFLGRSFRGGIDPKVFFSASYLQARFSAFVGELKDFAKICLPVALAILFLPLALTQANALHRYNLKDLLFLQWDFVLTGGFPFFTLQSLNTPPWFVRAVEFAFSNLAPFLVFVAFYIFYKNREAMRELAGAFSLTALIMFTFWFFMPALSPQDRFLDNVYRLPMPSQVAMALNQYHPQPEVASFLVGMREMKAPLPAMPTSTTPSAHVAWAALALWYLTRTRRLAALIAAPFLILSTFGTVFLAQHYFVDVVGGVAIATASILLMTFFVKKEALRA